MYHLIEPQPPNQNTNHPSNNFETKPTAIKQEPNILNQDHTVEVPRFRAFTPTKPQTTLQNAFQTNYHQQNIFMPTLRKQTNPQRMKKMTEIMEKIGSLEGRVSRLERTQQRINKAKRYRRKNSQLNKMFHCHIKNCTRKYDSETALKQHMRTKHATQSIDQQKKQKE